uniref:Uncharacterized protein n=1 Tax=Romanomermis culicivorax TaxID=13658 RepID=A0A915L0F0_ROMCU
MLDRLIEQKLPTMAALQGDKKFLLRDDQWTLAANLVEMLEPFESATRKPSLKSACVSQMIPFVETLKRRLEKSISNSILILSEHQMLQASPNVNTQKIFPCLVPERKKPREKRAGVRETVRDAGLEYEEQTNQCRYYGKISEQLF